jgi:hypothetical protein
VSKNPREMFRPQMPELSKQCASCPFLAGNEKEFGELVKKLYAKNGRPDVKPTPKQVFNARMNVTMEAGMRGDFACHSTVYDQNMEVKPREDHRQCPGATKYFKKSWPGKK